jgi:hypothetical protein
VPFVRKKVQKYGHFRDGGGLMAGISRAAFDSAQPESLPFVQPEP